MPRLFPLLIAGFCLSAAASCGPVERGVSARIEDDEGAPGDWLEELERRVAEVSARARASAVALEYSATDAASGARRVATGVVVNAQGDVLSIRIDRPTAGAAIVARDASGRRLPVRWVAEDPDTGLTLLRIEPRPSPTTTPTPTPTPALAPVALSASSFSSPTRRGPRLGSPVVVIGNPFGLGHSVSQGSVSGLDRRLELGARQIGGLIQINAPLHPGDSGALVVDLRGEWLGLVRSGLAAPGSGSGSTPAATAPEKTLGHDLGFVLPARDALWIADQLRAQGRVERAYLGVRIDLRGTGEPPGALLDSVLDDTPAARAGLRPGDRVVGLDGQPVRTPRDLTDRLDRTRADAETVVEFLRDDRLDRRVVHTTRRPPVEPVPDRPSTPRPSLADRLDRLEQRLKELERERERERELAKDPAPDKRPVAAQAP